MRYLLILVLTVFLFSCEGPIGPQGIQGIKGQEGADGTDGQQGVPGPGTRTVMTGQVTSNGMFVTIDGINFSSDPPVVDVLICPLGFACVPLPFTVFVNNVASFTTNFQLANTGILIINAKALYEVWGTESATYIIITVE